MSGRRNMVRNRNRNSHEVHKRPIQDSRSSRNYDRPQNKVRRISPVDSRSRLRRSRDKDIPRRSDSRQKDSSQTRMHFSSSDRDDLIRNRARAFAASCRSDQIEESMRYQDSIHDRARVFVSSYQSNDIGSGSYRQERLNSVEGLEEGERTHHLDNRGNHGRSLNSGRHQDVDEALRNNRREGRDRLLRQPRSRDGRRFREDDNRSLRGARDRAERFSSGQVTDRERYATVSKVAAICPLVSCRATVPFLREHILISHLPSCFANTLDTSVGTMRQRSIVLHAFAQELTDSGGLPGLLDMIQSSGLISGADELELDFIPALQAFSEFLGEPVPEHYTLNPPNACSVLTHWRILLQLLCVGGKDLQERLSSQSEAHKLMQSTSQFGAVSSLGPAAGRSVASFHGTGALMPPQFVSLQDLGSGNASKAGGPLKSLGRVPPSSDRGGRFTRSRVKRQSRRNNRLPSTGGVLSIGQHGRSSTGARHDLGGGRKEVYKRKRSPSADDITRTSKRYVEHIPRRLDTALSKKARRRRARRQIEHKWEQIIKDQQKQMDKIWRDNPGLQAANTVHSGAFGSDGQTGTGERLYPSRDPGLEQAMYGIGRERSLGRMDSGIPAAVDCHFYLDVVAVTLFTKQGLMRSSVGLDSLQANCPRPNKNPIQLVGAIGSFSNPNNYSLLMGGAQPEEGNTSWYTQDGRLGLSVGLNPKFSRSLTDSLLEHIRQLARLPSMKAYGDVGLSYSTGDEDDWALQRTNLRRLLRIAPSSLPVKLSCRKQARGTAANARRRDTYQDLLDIAREELAPMQPIYLASFDGNVKTVRSWLSLFPNCYFGISPKCISSALDTKSAIGLIPEDRLLLESSSPAFRLRGYTKPSPLFLGMLAMYVAKFRGLEDAFHILAVTTANARRLFSLA